MKIDSKTCGGNAAVEAALNRRQAELYDPKKDRTDIFIWACEEKQRIDRFVEWRCKTEAHATANQWLKEYTIWRLP